MEPTKERRGDQDAGDQIIELGNDGLTISGRKT